MRYKFIIYYCKLSYYILIVFAFSFFTSPLTAQITEPIEGVRKGQNTLQYSFDSYQKEANKGNTDAMFKLAWMYFTGNSVKKDTSEGMIWLEKAAKNGHEKAMNNLGKSLQLKRTKEDSAKAFVWFLSAANLGNTNSMAIVGQAYWKGQGVEKDTAEGLKWYLKAAENDNDKAMYWMGYIYDHGKGVIKDSVKSLFWYKKGVDAGNSDAQNNLAIKYRKGRWVEKNYTMALELLQKSAAAGNVYGMYNLGIMYEYGKGVEQDYQIAFKWYKKSAEKSNKSGASFKLGEFYEFGKGVLEKDYIEAIKWYKNSVDIDDLAISYYRIGNMYEQGKGLEKNLEEAMKYYKLSANANNGLGMYSLGHLYEKLNIPIYPDIWYTKALAWFENDIIKTLDNTYSMKGLALMYEQGNGIKKNIAKAIELYKMAADLGDEDAKIKVKELLSIP